MIKTIKGSLFNAPKNSIIIHACNTKGVWGTGIAKQFAEKYPNAYQIYRETCQEKGSKLIGTCLLIQTDKHIIACLFTSIGYGEFKDTPEQILKNTKSAVEDLIKQNISGLKLYSCKINSGRFAVPWDDTKRILEESGVDIIVYES